MVWSAQCLRGGSADGGSLGLSSLLCGLGDLACTGGLLLNALDDSNSHGLPHVTDSETTCLRGMRLALSIHVTM